MDSIQKLTLKNSLLDFSSGLGYPHAIALLLIVLVVQVLRLMSHEKQRLNVPIQGYLSTLEPTIILKARFTLGARNIIKGAYKLVSAMTHITPNHRLTHLQMKDKPFMLLRSDVDFMVLPIKYLEEIRLVPMSKLSARGAQVGVSLFPSRIGRSMRSDSYDQNLEPEWTGVSFLMHSNLHVNVLKQKLIPELWKWVDKAADELAYGWPIEIAEANGKSLGPMRKIDDTWTLKRNRLGRG